MHFMPSLLESKWDQKEVIQFKLKRPFSKTDIRKKIKRAHKALKVRFYSYLTQI